MSDPLSLLDFYVRGVASGAMLVLALSVLRSKEIAARARLAVLFLSISTIAWIVTESAPTWALFGRNFLLLAAAMPQPGLFWLAICIVFDDSPPHWTDWALAAYLLATGLVMIAVRPPLSEAIWFLRNFSSALITLHAGYLVIRGQRDDLLERRRRLRAVVIGLMAIFGVAEAVTGILNRLQPGPYAAIFVGQPLGVALFCGLMLAICAAFMQGRPDLFGPRVRRTRDQAGASSARAEAVDQALLDKLNALMEAGAWRKEGLTIGGLAQILGAPEHRGG